MNNKIISQDIVNINEAIEKSTSVGQKYALKVLQDYLNNNNEKNIAGYTNDDWINLFEWGCNVTQSFPSLKTRFVKFLVEYKYPDSVIQSLKSVSLTGGTNYILSLDFLIEYIKYIRRKTMGDYFSNNGECDNLSSAEICCYLLWMGIKTEDICKIKLADVDITNMCITINKNTIKIPSQVQNRVKQYYYANEFGTFKGAKIAYYKYNKYGFFISGSKGNFTSVSVNKSINERFDLSASLIYKSGRMYVGYQKYLNGYKPNFYHSSWDESIFKFFEIDELMSYNKILYLKYDWNRYLEQQKAGHNTLFDDRRSIF